MDRLLTCAALSIRNAGMNAGMAALKGCSTVGVVGDGDTTDMTALLGSKLEVILIVWQKSFRDVRFLKLLPGRVFCPSRRGLIAAFAAQTIGFKSGRSDAETGDATIGKC